MKPVLHPQTEQYIGEYGSAPAHAVLLIAPKGSGKATVAITMAAAALHVADARNYPYTIQMEDTGAAIGIETIRELEQFLALKVPGRSPYNRVIIIENASRLTLEAQNALLKNLEEPPTGTLFILTADRPQAVLPTIRSRTQLIHLVRPDKASLIEGFADFDVEAIERSYAVSGGLPGLMQALLAEDDHPLREAVEQARKILTATSYERLIMADSLAKNKELSQHTIYILQQMAHIKLQTGTGASAKQWQRILEASYQAADQLSSNTQTKLVLTNLMLHL